MAKLDEKQSDNTNDEEKSSSTSKQTAHEKRKEQTAATIKKYTAGAMAVGVVPFPLLDLAALAAIQLKMLHSLSKIYDVEFEASLGKSAVSSLAGGVASVSGAAPLAASLTKFIPVVGHALSYTSLVVLNGASTFAIGKVFEQHFASGGTFLTFDPTKVREYFTEQFEKGKKLVTEMGEKSKSKPKMEPATATK
ncbi:MAG: DUF697 domain-containing protein [Magnetococcales bacterium]|nr:DUF697 domain-containing protein [Magnetococcales bacterium]